MYLCPAIFLRQSTVPNRDYRLRGRDCRFVTMVGNFHIYWLGAQDCWIQERDRNQKLKKIAAFANVLLTTLPWPCHDLATLTLLSSPPVTTYWPSGEYARHAMLLKWPCCLSTYDSLCHSHTSSWPRSEQPIATQSPDALNDTVLMLWLEMLQVQRWFN